MNAQFRNEEDALGRKAIPKDAYYGVQTVRARENFPISGIGPHRAMVEATALIKKAAAQAHLELGELPPAVGEAILKATDEILEGKFRDQFVVDVFQAGAGTSHNMNVNEVIANRACEILGGRKGDHHLVHPNDHVNLGQSSNDVIPTAIRLAALSRLPGLLSAARGLENALRAKAKEFKAVVKAGRTHLQDALPVTLGLEFGAYATAIGKCCGRIETAKKGLLEIGLGGTAVGTGLNATPAYRRRVVGLLSEFTGHSLKPAKDYLEITQNIDAFLEMSGALRLLAVALIRMANDLRLLSSGPRTGLGEISLPAVQPGSSMMPGKVNPSLAEAVDMLAFQVMGNDLAIALACQAGQLELNVMTPVVAHNLLQSIEILTNGMNTFTERCVKGIQANEERCRRMAEESAGLATLLSPLLGYSEAAKVCQQAIETGKSIREMVIERGLMTDREWEQLLSKAARPI
jgi:aspartate ammonia-lyase